MDMFILDLVITQVMVATCNSMDMEAMQAMEVMEVMVQQRLAL
jgi:hypothetical protein